tara:strand:+ start:407 stop:730 length:324 start_codon:yes stop_codon:yes gene_type:complete
MDMKHYLYFIAATLLIALSGTSYANPSDIKEEQPPKTILTVANFETMTSTYPLVWVVNQDASTSAKKYIWVKNDDGYVVVSEPKNTPILKLAFNLDNYNHAVQKKEN